MKLRDWRKMKRLTLEQVGARLGTTGVSVGRYEREERMPDRDTLRKISEVTKGDVTANDFIEATCQAAE
jgi:transcriptional regulator with XRE-family HTH domain